MNKFLYFFLFGFGVSTLFSGCQIAPTRYEAVKQGRWQARALVRDKRAQKSFIVSLDINAIQNERLRVDITAAMGHPVASLVLHLNQLNYLLLETQQAYVGPASEAAMRPVLTVPLNPKILYSLVFDAPIENKDWTCTRDEKNFLADCQNLRSGMKLKWSERKGSRKTVFIDHPLASLQINFNSFQPKVEDRPNLFALSVPKNFKLLRL